MSKQPKQLLSRNLPACSLVRFKYSGGSTPNKMRTAYIVERLGSYYKTFCFDCGQMRSYSMRKMSDATLIGNCKIISTDCLPKDFRSTIAQFEVEGYTVFNYVAKKELVMVKMSRSVTVYGSYGGVTISADEVKIQDTRGTTIKTVHNPTVDDIINAVTKVSEECAKIVDA